MSLLPEIYADFQNADAHGRVRLNCVGTVNDLSRQQVQLREGLDVLLYSDDADDGNANRLIAEGRVAYSQEEQCWVAIIDWQKIRHQLDESPAALDGGRRASISPMLHGNTTASPSVRPAEH